MASFADRYPENVPGKYYVDTQCTDCDLCREVAPQNFRRNDDGCYSYVYKQPTTPEEIAQCEEAFECCPCEEIGNNGDTFDWYEPAYQVIHAAARGDVLGVKTALSAGFDVNSQMNGLTALILTAQAPYEPEVGIEPYITITGILLGHGADPNLGMCYSKKGALNCANGERKRPIAALLIRHGAKPADSIK